ncbi:MULTISPECIES: GRAM domain-containing protein [Bacillus]|uniref:GRAM domain-containing protein n=1 Tax=Bacillus glycinifermentans TaxID=1664069 RepID=A0AAJ4D454_9BACI|nr:MULTISPECIES: GRAM domain-containing protein [Bacillus]KKB71547.1 hypothetical protein TH62_22505 [Bacillus sp. TH008]MDU0073535.1 GRAM domain-containing protein [Bacillus sp. IG6]MED8021811.1 GRAM domain-containing protein [Bacillus glycinifermentans]QAT66642.1 hypothetical protein EQZ20_18310 [Bacillus glycinifermentans]WKB76390.1 GRAM domain-containing protein [Bacillus glycinifermentans]
MQSVEHEGFIMDVPANLFRGIESVGGRLKLTSESLFFTSHGVNIQNKPLDIKIQDIAKVEKRNTFLVVPNGLKVVLKNQQEYKFVVAKRQEFFNHLENLL